MKLGLVTIQRDRAQWIREWVAFHYLVGFRNFYIYLHKCSDNSEEIVSALSSKFNIKYFLVSPDLNRPQDFCYKHAYDTFGHEIDWMAFLDGDEFLYSTNNYSLSENLEPYLYSRISALGVYWRCFGSSFYVDEPQGFVIENYTRCTFKSSDINKHVKSLVIGHQMGLVSPGPDPHVFNTPLGTCDENMNIIESGISRCEPTFNKFCINHYATQSRSYFLKFKANSGTPMDRTDNKIIRGEWWWNIYDVNEDSDDQIFKYLPSLRELISELDSMS